VGTKVTVIIKNILASHFLQTIKEEIEQVPFYGVLTDASNHNVEKLFPFIIQYFSVTKGMQLK
jgi:hypothetical protein